MSMDLTDATPTMQAGVAERLLIAVPFYRNAKLVRPLLNSLLGCRAELAAFDTELLLLNDSPEDPTLAHALAAMQPALSAAFHCRIEANKRNLGFVRSMNRAIAEAVAGRRDLLLLNSDTVVEPGAIAEMVRVSRLDPMIGFVNPRSDNATVATLPLDHRLAGTAPAERRAAYADFAARLPEISFVPTAVGFCLLVRWHILAEFGGFDEIYGHGYNEENDLVMRAGRCGYRAALANHAFVWHQGEASFAAAAVTRRTLEARNRRILDARYPEYAGRTACHFDSPESVAERLLAELTPDGAGRLDIALDFSSFRADHNGTFRAGRQLLEAAAASWGARYNLAVIATAEVYGFHDYASLGVPRCDPHTDRRFAAVFRVGQPYDWNAVQRLAVGGAVIGAFMLDAISIDCPQLFTPRLYNLWQFTLDHLDVLVTQSRHTAQQVAARFRLPPGAQPIVAPHSLMLGDYAFPAVPADADAPGQSLLVVGNHFHHKCLAATANALASAFPDRQVVALGQKPGRNDPLAPPDFIPAANLTALGGGDLDECAVGTLYAEAALVVFPSHAEGFGFPLLHALAMQRPVFVRRLPVFLELREAMGFDPNLHFYETTAELIERLRDPPRWIAVDRSAPSYDADRAAQDILEAIEAALARADYGRIVARVRATQFASDVSAPEGAPGPGAPPPLQAAHFIGRGVERVTGRVLSWPPAYRATRLAFRGWRRARLLLRKGAGSPHTGQPFG